ncbi:MAG: helix-hairpin-helix domain-containing protein [Candidatus Omnitrophica bacterium]|jgi:competence ComEA-like helix-hairpin-helix protein|nr:helix-hairpin-helix domain-containing protein [Candidatus Omnitrophota bacterium]MDD5574876.1 helix-hairpin-helix domain-containing protein [Candidatus Omnitrophota bacterium]
MISLTLQERKVLIFLCVLLGAGLFLTHGRKAADCNHCLIEVYGDEDRARALDLNRATFQELVALPGIGEKTAEAILKVRSLKGRFNSVDELEVLKGISGQKARDLKKYLFVT